MEEPAESHTYSCDKNALPWPNLNSTPFWGLCPVHYVQASIRTKIVPCPLIGRCILMYWTTREVLIPNLLFLLYLTTKFTYSRVFWSLLDYFFHHWLSAYPPSKFSYFIQDKAKAYSSIQWASARVEFSLTEMEKDCGKNRFGEGQPEREDQGQCF